MKNIDVLKRKCLRCGHAWLIRKPEEPISCPSCHSPYWNKPRRSEKEIDA